jgi:FkbM family methyltransferase
MILNKKMNTKKISSVNMEVGLAFIEHVGWLCHDHGEEVIQLLRQGHYEAAEQAFFWLYLRPDDKFIDCGAHIGLYSVLASKATNGNIRMLSVEANSRTAKHLTLNLKQNGVTHVNVVEAAIWDSSGEISFTKGEGGEAAYDHVAFDSKTTGFNVPTITLNKLVEDSGGTTIALVKIDVEGAESEAIIGGKAAIDAGLLPVLMVEFTQNNLNRRGLDTDYLYKQLIELGYSLCEFNAERLQLVPFMPDGPIWYTNLFACQDLARVNQRLALACDSNKKIALDILARAAACSRFKDLENLETYKQQSNQSKELGKWAERTEALLVTERESSKELREWAERTEALLVTEREGCKELREWAERTEALLVTERESCKELREWAERTEATLLTVGLNSGKLQAELDELRFFTRTFNWLYWFYKKIKSQ